MGWYLDGRVAAVVGTHTHVPTADARILPDGTAYVTDAGMTRRARQRPRLRGRGVAPALPHAAADAPDHRGEAGERNHEQRAGRDRRQDGLRDEHRARRPRAHLYELAERTYRGLSATPMAHADFHNHSTASDGKLTPTQMVDLAAANGVRIFALTDHDSTEGIAEARQAASKHPGFVLVPGVELSTDIEGDEVHVLGYFTFEQLREPGAAGRAGEVPRRTLRARQGDGREADRASASRSAGSACWRSPARRPWAGRTSRRRWSKPATSPTIPEAFDLYIGRNGPAYVEREKMTPLEAVADAAALRRTSRAGPPQLHQERRGHPAGARCRPGSRAWRSTTRTTTRRLSANLAAMAQALRHPAPRRQRLPRPEQPRRAGAR